MEFPGIPVIIAGLAIYSGMAVTGAAADAPDAAPHV